MARQELNTFGKVVGKVKAVMVTAAGKPASEISSAAAAVGMGGATALGTTAGSLILLGGFGAVSAISNQLEYLAEREELANFYREELAAKNHKHQNQVRDGDLSAAEKNNSVIKEAVGRERSFRNVGIAASFIASIAVYALIHAGLGVHIPFELSVPFAAKVAVSVASYLAIKSPLMKAGAALLGLNKETTHELIENIARDREQGKAITREQVVEVFVSGNKQIGGYVRQKFGRDYEELSLVDKVKLAAELANVIPVDKMVHNINLGTTNASELAYTVQGDVSGALPKAPERKKAPTMYQQFADRCSQMVYSVTGMFGAEKASPVAVISAINQSQKTFAPVEDAPIVEFNEGPSFVERLGCSPREQTMSHAQEITQRRAEQVQIAGTATIQ